MDNGINLSKLAQSFVDRVVSDPRIAGTVLPSRNGRMVTCESVHSDRLALARAIADSMAVPGTSIGPCPGGFVVRF